MVELTIGVPGKYGEEKVDVTVKSLYAAYQIIAAIQKDNPRATFKICTADETAENEEEKQ